MRRGSVVAVWIGVQLISWATLPGAAQDGAGLVEEVRERVRTRIEAGEVPGALSADGEPLRARVALSSFYERRAFEPAWIGADGPMPHLDELTTALEAGDLDGLRPGHYHGARIAEALEETRARASAGLPAEPGALADLELLSTDAFLLFASHLSLGRVDPESLDAKWVANRREFDAAAALERGLAEGVRATLAALRPRQALYEGLRTAYERYRALADAGGWPTVPDGPSLEPGARDPRAAAIRRRLAVTGEISAGELSVAGGSDLYDATLERAVRTFQQRHGLGADGVVGPATLAALNVSAADRARTLWLNLERWRWLPADLGRLHVIVNAANFELDVVEDGEEVFTSRVMVGRPFRRTPVFSDRISYLVVSPYWNVPHSLAVQDQVPAQKRDTGYFARVGMRVFQGWGDEAAEIDPATIDWGRLEASRFPYRLRQDPGPLNFLGAVKIMFPNRFNVYLHDTPLREGYQRARRDFSSGCIRVERALELAEFLLRPVPGWDMARMRRAVDARREETVRLASEVPVHLLYMTAWVARDGTVHFREDIYERDGPLETALHGGPPAG
ncbi:MAG: L,D-transpeptidase family protein [Gemmatimonadota bacterium]|nr:L,D-transpeptidase family protein [Gemmatimonadota bacterium]